MWEPLAAPKEPGWGWLCPAYLMSPVGRSGGPQVAFRVCAGFTHRVLRCRPHHTPCSSLGSLSFALVGSEALGWFDHSWGLVCGICLSAWIRVATGLPEQQMVAAWGPAIHPSGQLFTRHHDDRKVSKKILCDSRVGRSVGLGAVWEGGLGPSQPLFRLTSWTVPLGHIPRAQPAEN